MDIIRQDIFAAWEAHNSRSEEDSASMAPDPETARLARAQYRRGIEVLKEYKVFASPKFPVGADPQGARLNAFCQDHAIVAYAEADAGYIATSAQRCYLGLATR